ncbi:MAG: hypothetical protein M3440_02755 [Chloroflexota bacterium]|nr:hypothetical protein [Chloroflexota bacterium]
MSTAMTSIVEPTLAPITGIWDAEEAKLFTRYRVSLTFTGRVMGGVPQKPEMIEGWLRQRITGGDEEVRAMMVNTLDELGVDVAAGMSMEELKEAAKRVAAEQHGNTFRRDERGLFLAAYQFKAAMKENVSILFPYSEKANRMGPTSKAARAFWAERVFVDDERVYLGRDEPDGIHLQIGHISGPKGPRSTLTYYDFVEQGSCTFTVSSLQDMVGGDMWRDTFLAMQRNGIGALRSLGYGQMKVTGFEQL